jgi:hypothetical protein
MVKETAVESKAAIFMRGKCISKNSYGAELLKLSSKVG